MHRSFLWSILLLVSFISRNGIAEPNEQTPRAVGEIVSVILYRDNAMVTREVTFDDVGGEVIVEGLPQTVRPSGVFAEGGEGVSVRGVQVVPTPAEGPSAEELETMDDEIRQRNRAISEAERRVEVARQQLAAIDAMVDFGQAAGDADLKRGVLDADALIELVDAAGERRAEYEMRILEGTGEIAALRRELERAEEDRKNRASQTSRQTYQARVFYDVRDGDGDNEAAVTLRLRYTVEGCRWAPQYSITHASESDEFVIRYGAVIEQSSGEDWDDVALTLSTASPNVSAAGPTLTALKVRAGRQTETGQDGFDPAQDPFGGNAANRERNRMGVGMSGGFGGGMMPSQMSKVSPFRSKMRSLRLNQIAIEQRAGVEDPFSDNLQRDVGLNRFAGEIQQLELTAAADEAAADRDGDAEVASQTYAIETPLTIASRRDGQVIEIRRLTFKGQPVHVAVPLLSSFTYRRVELTNTTDMALLRGPATVYIDDRFVGGMELSPTAAGQTFVVGLGADDRIRLRRDLLSRDDKISGANRQMTLRYRLTVANYRDRDIPVRLLDRIPRAVDEQRVKVSLGDISRPLSDDALYEKHRRPEGILRWDLSVPASAKGEDAFEVLYGYQIELPENLQLSVPDPAG